MNSEDPRFSKILEILSAYERKDFSQALPVSSEKDQLDQLSAGIQKLSKELQEYQQERTLLLQQIEELKQKEEKFQKAFEASAAGIAITRLSDSTYIEVNNTFTILTGFTKEEIIGSTSLKLGFIVNIQRREEILQFIREHGYAKNFELTIRQKSGAIIEILSSVETILINGEKYAINIIYDITERKKAEQQLEEANKELESFSYSVSHDLRTPLRSINGYATIMEDEFGSVLNERALRFLQTIRANTAKMGKLIDDLLAFSRLGRKEIQKKTLNLNELTNSVIEEINKNTPHHAAIKVYNLHDVEADYSLLYQVIFNLLSNAIKYSAKKEHPLIEVSSRIQDGHIVVSIKDNGSGFDMKYKNKLFGVFQRLHSQEEFEGTGVGLAIVQRIIIKHGGKVYAEGKVDEGAMFEFGLPI